MSSGTRANPCLGLSGYGQWIALTALASYLAYSNFGLVTTSAYEMVMAVGAGDEVRARRTFQMSVNLTLYVILPLILVMLAGLTRLPVVRIFRLSNISSTDAILILSLGASQIWIQTLRGMVVAALYAAGSYGFSYDISGFTKFLELMGIVAAVIFFKSSQLGAAEIMAACALLDLLIVSFYAHRTTPWARPDFLAFDTAWLAAQVKPAVGLAISTFPTRA